MKSDFTRKYWLINTKEDITIVERMNKGEKMDENKDG